MEVPKEVLKAAAGLVEMYGPKLTLLGEREGQAVYLFQFPKDLYTGFPFVYLYEEGRPALEVTGEDALEIIGSFDVE